jgi:hypothetical protein
MRELKWNFPPADTPINAKHGYVVKRYKQQQGIFYHLGHYVLDQRLKYFAVSD